MKDPIFSEAPGCCEHGRHWVCGGCGERSADIQMLCQCDLEANKTVLRLPFGIVDKGFCTPEDLAKIAADYAAHLSSPEYRAPKSFEMKPPKLEVYRVDSGMLIGRHGVRVTLTQAEVVWLTQWIKENFSEEVENVS